MTKALAEFLKTTMIGGLLIVVPTYLTVILLVKALGGMVALLGAIVALLPQRVHHLGPILAIALAVLVCFMLGLIARAGAGRRAIEAFERRVLERMPGFALLRSVVRRVSGSSDDAQFQPVLVEIEEAHARDHRGGNRRRPLRRAGTIGANTSGGFPLHPAAPARTYPSPRRSP